MTNLWDGTNQRAVHANGAAPAVKTASETLSWANVNGGSNNLSAYYELDARAATVSIRVDANPGIAHNGRKLKIAVNRDDTAETNFRGVIFTNGNPVERGSLVASNVYTLDRRAGHIVLEVVNGRVRINSGASFNTDPQFAPVRVIQITGAAGAGANYVIPLLIGESAGSVGADFTLPSTVAFPASRGDSGGFLIRDPAANLCPHWVDQITGTTPNRVARAWVRVPAGLATNTNLSITPVSPAWAGEDVFTQHFDEFTGPALSALWTDGATVGTFSGGVYSFGGGNTAKLLTSVAEYGDGVELMANIRLSDTSASTSEFGFQHATNANDFMFNQVWNGVTKVLVGTVGTATTVGVNHGAGVRSLARLGRNGGAGRFRLDSPAINMTFAGVPTAAAPWLLYNTYDNTTEIDWAAVRPYVQTEPVFGSTVS